MPLTTTTMSPRDDLGENKTPFAELSTSSPSIFENSSTPEKTTSRTTTFETTSQRRNYENSFGEHSVEVSSELPFTSNIRETSVSGKEISQDHEFTYTPRNTENINFSTEEASTKSIVEKSTTPKSPTHSYKNTESIEPISSIETTKSPFTTTILQTNPVFTFTTIPQEESSPFENTSGLNKVSTKKVKVSTSSVEEITTEITPSTENLWSTDKTRPRLEMSTNKPAILHNITVSEDKETSTTHIISTTPEVRRTEVTTEKSNVEGIEEPNKNNTEETFNIDLSIPGSSLSKEISKVLPNILPDITTQLNNQSSITLTFTIKPPDHTLETDLKSIVDSLRQIIPIYIPNNEVQVKLDAQKDHIGYITQITIHLTIIPAVIRTPSDDTLTIDLSKPDTLDTQMHTILPKILPKVEKSLEDNRTAIFTCKIKPRPGVTRSYLPVITNNMKSILVQYFPKNKLAFEVRVIKDSRDHLTEIIIIITIEPTPEQKDTRNIDINLTKPITLADQIQMYMPTVLTKILEKLSSMHPATFTITIKPPTGSTPEFIQQISIPIKNVLIKYFPSYEIELNSKASKDSQGFLSVIIVNVTIRPIESTTLHEEDVDIDLTKPGPTSITQLKDKLPNLLKQVTDGLNENEPVTLIVTIKSPAGSIENQLQDAIKPVIKMFTNYFPKNQIKVKLNGRKLSESPSVLKVNITFEPISSNDNNVDIDLRKPGTTLLDQVNEKMPNLLERIKNTLKDNQPVTLILKIRPPKGSTESYVGELTKSVVIILTNYFPHNKIEVNVNAEKNPQSYITSVRLEITFHPTQTEDIIIDLTAPGSTLFDEVERRMPNLSKEIMNTLNINKPANLTFKVKPPIGSDENYLRNLANYIANIVASHFPNNSIKIKLKAQKNPQGYVTLVTIKITLKPHSNPAPAYNGVYINLAQPGVDAKQEFEKIIPILKQNVTLQLIQRQPVISILQIKPPKNTLPSYLEVIKEILQNILEENFPGNQCSVEGIPVKNSRGFITKLIMHIKIEENVDIDLSKPGSILTDQIKEIILPNITNSQFQREPVTHTFKIKPPQKSTQEFLQKLSETLRSFLSENLPNNKIKIKMTAEKDSENFLSLITIEIKIQLSSNENPNEGANIDLSKAGVNLIDQVNQYLTKITPQVTASLDQDKSFNITLHIKPPYGSKSDYVQIVVNSLVPALNSFLPDCEKSLDASADKDSRDYLKKILLVIRVKRLSKPKDYITNIDLQHSRYTLPEQVDKSLPNILTKLQDDLKVGKSVTLTYKVIPPIGFTEEYVQSLIDSLVPTLTKYFVRNKMDVKSKVQKDSQNIIRYVTIIITIETHVQLEKINIDLSQYSSSLENEVSNVLPKLLPQLQSALNHGRPITLKFNITPPSNSKKMYMRQLTNKLATVLPGYFPTNEMTVKTSSTENSGGFISDITLLIFIKP